MKYTDRHHAVALSALAVLGLSLAGCADYSSADPYYQQKIAATEAKDACKPYKCATPAPCTILTKKEAEEKYAPLQPPAPDVRLVNEAAVFLPGTTKAYAIGRYRDPSNHAILHEPHVILRHEEDSSYVMNAGRENEVIVGQTRSGSSRRYHMVRPALQRNEIGAALTRSDSASAKLVAETQRQKASTDALITAADSMNKNTSRETQVSRQVSSMQGEVQTLQSEVANLKAQATATPPSLPVATPPPAISPTKDKGPAIKPATPSQTSDNPQVGADGRIQ